MLRTLLLSTLLVASFIVPLAAAQTWSCTFTDHDGRNANACIFDAQQGNTPACPGTFNSTGFNVQANGVGQAYGSGYEMQCDDGTHSQGMFLVLDMVGVHQMLSWENGNYGGGSGGCSIDERPVGSGTPNFDAPCPAPMPNPGWGHLLP